MILNLFIACNKKTTQKTFQKFTNEWSERKSRGKKYEAKRLKTFVCTE